MSQTEEAANQEIKEFSVVDNALAELRERFSAIPDAATADGYKSIKEGVSKLTGYRTALDKAKKKLKGPLLDEAARIEAEYKRVYSAVAEIEAPLKAAKKVVDDEKARIEAERKEKIQARIAGIRMMPVNCAGAGIEDVSAMIEAADKLDHSIGFYEFSEEAAKAIGDTRTKLDEQLQNAVEQARLAAEREAEEARRRAEDEERRKIDAARAEEDARRAREDEARAAEQAELDELREDKRKREEAAEAERLRAEQEELDAAEADDIAHNDEMIQKQIDAEKQPAEPANQEAVDQKFAEDLDEVREQAPAITIESECPAPVDVVLEIFKGDIVYPVVSDFLTRDQIARLRYDGNGREYELVLSVTRGQLIKAGG